MPTPPKINKILTGLPALMLAAILFPRPVQAVTLIPLNAGMQMTCQFVNNTGGQYANSQIYDVETGKRTCLEVDLHRGLVIHLPQGEGKCTLHWADIHAGFEGVRLAEQVWKWRSRKDLLAAV